METARPEVNDIVKVYCSDHDMTYYYGRVTNMDRDGLEIDTLSCMGKAYFTYKSNAIVIVGHEKYHPINWAHIGNMEIKNASKSKKS